MVETPRKHLLLPRSVHVTLAVTDCDGVGGDEEGHWWEGMVQSTNILQQWKREGMKHSTNMLQLWKLEGVVMMSTNMLQLWMRVGRSSGKGRG